MDELKLKTKSIEFQLEYDRYLKKWKSSGIAGNYDEIRPLLAFISMKISKLENEIAQLKNEK